MRNCSSIDLSYFNGIYNSDKWIFMCSKCIKFSFFPRETFSLTLWEFHTMYLISPIPTPSSPYIYLVLTTHPTQPSVCLSLPLSSPIKSNFYCSDPLEYGACPESDLQWSHSFRKLILPFSVFSNCFLFKNPLCNCFCLKAELEMTSLVLFSTFLWFYFFCDLFTRLILILFSIRSESGLSTPKTRPGAVLPPAQFCLPKVPEPLQTILLAGDQVCKHKSLWGAFVFKPQYYCRQVAIMLL